MMMMMMMISDEVMRVREHPAEAAGIALTSAFILLPGSYYLLSTIYYYFHSFIFIILYSNKHNKARGGMLNY